MREKQIERLVSYYTEIFHTTDPLAIAQRLNIIVQFGDLGEYSGCYMFLKNHRCIMISEQLEGPERLFVLAHELGHALLHRKQDCYFLRGHTYLNSRLEREANYFASLMVISDDFLVQHTHCSTYDISKMYGCDLCTVEKRIHSFNDL